MAEALSRELALRIGLAAKVLPGVDARELLQVLVSKLGYPLTDKSLREITVTDIRAAMTSPDGEEDTEDTAISKDAMKLAVRYLWGEDVKLPEMPKVVPYEEGDMPGSIRIAIATNSAEVIDGHFGSCPRFVVYQLSTDELRLIDIRPTDGADESEDKNAFRAEIIADCDVLYVQSVGGPAAAKVIRAGIYPIKLPEGGEAAEALSRLQQTLAGTPPPWLAKIIGIDPEKRTKFSAEAEA
jgi:nitrogen fixation protein NifX